MCSGERPIGAAKGKQSDTEALCQPPPPPSPCVGVGRMVASLEVGAPLFHPPPPPPPHPLRKGLSGADPPPPRAGAMSFVPDALCRRTRCWWRTSGS